MTLNEADFRHFVMIGKDSYYYQGELSGGQSKK